MAELHSGVQISNKEVASKQNLSYIKRGSFFLMQY